MTTTTDPLTQPFLVLNSVQVKIKELVREIESAGYRVVEDKKVINSLEKSEEKENE